MDVSNLALLLPLPGALSNEYAEELHPRDPSGRWTFGMQASLVEASAVPTAKPENVRPETGRSKFHPVGTKLKPLTIEEHGAVTTGDRVMVNVIGQELNADQTTNKVVLVGRESTLGSFRAGGETFNKGGEWDDRAREATCKNYPAVIAHELGHAEFHYAQAQAGQGLQDRQHDQRVALTAAGDSEHANRPDAYWSPTNPTGYLGADGKIRIPADSRDRLFNAMVDFRSVHSDRNLLPTDYAKSWGKERVTDSNPRVVNSYHQSAEGGWHSVTVSDEISMHRSANEAYAEYSGARAMKRLQDRGLLSEKEANDEGGGRGARYYFRSQGKPEGRRAYEAMKKAVDAVALDSRRGLLRKSTFSP